jgi:5-methylcytosine-specific restriction protein A
MRTRKKPLLGWSGWLEYVRRRFYPIMKGGAPVMGRKANPPWKTDELILALDLYLRRGSNVGIDDEELVAVSQVLNALPLHEERGTWGTFRNPNGVAMKLGNFASLDPSYDGKGLARGSAADRRVWDRFHESPDEVEKIAAAIRRGALAAKPPRDPEVGEESSPEGKVLFRLHRRSERDSLIVRRKKDSVKQATGRLACEVCELDFEERYGEVGTGFIECHHLVPLSEGKERATSLSDLVLLCSNCHRMIHRTDPLETPEKLRSRLMNG